MLHRILFVLALILAPVAAEAQLCAGQSAVIAADGRAYGHLPYGDVAEGDLVVAPREITVGQPCLLRPEALADLQRLIAAAAGDPAAMGQLRAISCHRSIARQADVFCRERPADPADRAISVAPPGYSEHSTGYALDFAVRPSPNCPDIEACMANTPTARWLHANGPKFGFENSFPGGNAQRVKWEPWHWRWVGVSADVPGAARARFVFARAREQFPARPGIVPIVVSFVAQPPVPVVAAPVEVKKNKKRR